MAVDWSGWIKNPIPPGYALVFDHVVGKVYVAPVGGFVKPPDFDGRVSEPR